MENLKILLKKREELNNKIYDILIEKVRQKARTILNNNENLDETEYVEKLKEFFKNKK